MVSLLHKTRPRRKNYGALTTRSALSRFEDRTPRAIFRVRFGNGQVDLPPNTDGTPHRANANV